MKKDIINIDNEYLVLSYFLRNPKELNIHKANQFINLISKSIANSILKLKDKNLSFSLETIYSFAIEEKDFNFEILQNIYDNFTDFTNIDYHKSLLESDYTKNLIVKNLVKDLIVRSQSNDFISVEEVLSATDNIRKSLISTLDTAILKDTRQLSDSYRETLRRRKDGTLLNRSIGFRVLDNKLTKPGEPKELTIIAALRGSGKTAMKQTIQNNLVNKNIPVIEFSLEMSEDSNMDRTIAMRASLNTFDLNKNLSNELMRKAEKVLKDFERFNNFLSTDESDLSFDNIDSMLYKAKEIFYKRGVLRDDEYLIYTIDLLDMVNDFGDSKPIDIKRSMDKWFKINKKHNNHGIGIVQLNENKLRNMNFSELDDVDKYRPNLEDIYGGSAYAQRARTVMVLHNPRFMKERYFPELEDEWIHEPNLINCHIVKQNEGNLFLQQFIFDPTIMKIVPYYSCEEDIKN